MGLLEQLVTLKFSKDLSVIYRWWRGVFNFDALDRIEAQEPLGVVETASAKKISLGSVPRRSLNEVSFVFIFRHSGCHEHMVIT